ncbi:MAG: peroxide stress protein YaaA [Rhodobacteraceae bacterium]|nr:peroxide stress protein YaaA [Paracoccaceae bacterium]
MITVISPAKKLDYGIAAAKIEPTFPDFQTDAYSLSRTARGLSVAELQKLMRISQPLAKLNQDRFKAFEEFPDPDGIKPAAMVFAGDTYQGLEAASLDADELRYAQSHLRILSGLYGLLRPLDQIQPYRLEMGSRLATRRGKSLYQYWGGRLSAALNELAAENDAEFLLNCASVEYFTAVDAKALKPAILTPVFMETRDGQDKIVSFFAKRARGAMARFVVQNRITDVKGVKDFTSGGYAFQPELSDPNRPVFTRDYPAGT